MTPTNTQWPEETFRVKLRYKTQGQMLHDFSEAVKAKRASERPTIPEGFIPHDGGPCPVAEGTRVVVETRGDGRYGVYDACRFNWRHSPGGSASRDVIAYHIERDPKFKVEAGKFYITASGERVGPMQANADYCQVRANHRGFWNRSGDSLIKDAGWSLDILCLAADQTSPMVSE